ncbi:MAG: family 1 glycosylhydrolase [Spirochaetota bacterium]|jgi:beta-glucosidase|nr:family 1 glycosylhydrolase [Spirochaetota bacterium]
MEYDILYGASSAAAQIEGGDLRHNWNDWADKGRIKDGSSPRRACDHFHRWREDIDLMAGMGIRIYRMSVEWARIEPARGAYDAAAVAWYRELLQYLKSKGIAPLVTLHHFTHPIWFEEMGGFADPANIPVFLGFVRYAVQSFGDLVDEYVTLNEPNVFAAKGYMEGVFPPGKNSIPLAMKVQAVMASCHILAYELIHKLRREMGYANTKVGFAHHVRVFAPKSKWNPWHRLCSRLTARLFQGALTRACLLGRFIFPFKNYANPLCAGAYADFLGLNYYSRSTISGLADGVRRDSPKNDLGWEIFPEGIAVCAREIYALLPRPIYITENGTADNTDAFRCRCIYDHLQALKNSGLPVERYYHWCFTDNFEWAEGEVPRFGLVYIDYNTQKRALKKSGRFYAALIKNKGVTEAMYTEYVAPEQYHS